LPSSALPYIYTPESPARSQLSTHTIFPPLKTASFSGSNISIGLKEKQQQEELQLLDSGREQRNQRPISKRGRGQLSSKPHHHVPLAADTIKQAISSKNAMDRNGKRFGGNTREQDDAIPNMCSQSKNNDDMSDKNSFGRLSLGHSEGIRQVYSNSSRSSSNASTGRSQSIESNEKNMKPASIVGRFTARITTSLSRTDPSGKLFTSYVVCVQTSTGRYNIEHRYSDFSRIYKELRANGIKLSKAFPNKSWAGRIGDWTRSVAWAPEANKELIRRREKLLDMLLVELCEALQDTTKCDSFQLHGEIRHMVEHFLQKSSTAVPPCDRTNHVSWDGFLDNADGEIMEYSGEMKHFEGVQKYVGNPVTFTLTSSIRQAAYTVMHMCGTKSTLTTVKGERIETDQSIPLDLLQQAKGLVFLTVVKAGVLLSVRGGTGLMVARRKDGGWTPPVALGTIGVGWGILCGGDITSYLIVLNTHRAVKIFAQNQSVNLGAELGVAVGPLGRAATGNLNAGPGGMPAPAYAYAHSKGLFAGISVEGSIVCLRQDVNAKFYGKGIDARELLFESKTKRPKAAQPLYDALNEAMSMEVPERGFRPSEVINQGARKYFSKE